MIGMKGDMGGAAAVLGAFRAIAALGAKVRVLGFLPITDNMTGGDATRVGDVLTIRNGKTVEVLNTDAEGRLILADAPVAGLRGGARRHRRPRHPHRRLHGGPGRPHRRPHGQPPGVGRPGAGRRRRRRRAGVAAAPPRLPPRQARQRARRPQEHHEHPVRRRARGRRVPRRSSSARASRGPTSTSPAPPTRRRWRARSSRAAPASACARSWRCCRATRSHRGDPLGGQRGRDR